MTMTLFRRKIDSAGKRPQEDSAQARAQEQFETLFQEHWTRLCGVLYRMTGSWAEAEDLALEAFIQLYRRPPAGEENLGGWLYRVATRLGLNALRARQRRQRYEEQALRLDLAEASDADPAAALEQAQERQRVRRALGRMRPRQAQALLLRASGLSYAEIAAALPAAPASIGTLLARAGAEFEKQYRKE